ncbi:aryl-sulfate sulfotransferase [Campylobacter geochelonis]|uniref:Arylsulfotransferase n=1 Tax=Campylobacter geochelonis TaxID=1780362 RepID=A0A128ED56_9BACT|nr:aryl-sulfate sulfotransferase [Campylobacter geochelonis]QKF70423.1 arylsulfate sulfotransferase [Campylobacter geochelonis]CZE46322.1 arylsulfotransferase [Campylobacter geochelonis]
MKKVLSSVVAAIALIAVAPSTVMAIGGPSGAKIDYMLQGQIGEVIMNPYEIAPLTAIIRNGGYVLKNASVRIVPKEGGQEIKYKVSDKHLLTHGGIPVFGLYPNYVTSVEVEYDRFLADKKEHFKETYKIYAPNVYAEPTGTQLQTAGFFEKANIVKVDPKFKDRLYLVNNLMEKTGKGAKVVWNNPTGGALEWDFNSHNFIIDTTGEIRWFLFTPPIHDLRSVVKSGNMMGFKQNDDGALSWGFGQRYVKYDILGRVIFNRELPFNYNDFSHSMDDSPNGNYFLRVASSNLKKLDGKNVRTVRDVVIEVDKDGVVQDEWRMFDILDPYRDVNFKVLDQGAVCLNIDASQAGKTLSAKDLEALDKSDKFGDIVGSGAGRNWLHANSVDHDAEDDSIIISSRHQSAIIKIGRDKKVKWILGSPEGWSDKYKPYLLTPVDSKGNKIDCGESGSKCPGYESEGGGFDWTWTQHTAFKIDEKSKGDIIYVSAFDNGDSRGMEQPALPSMKYSRGVIYKIDQKKMSVEQVWEYGKQRGNGFYSPVTSLTEYQADKDSVFIYSATAGGEFDFQTGGMKSQPNPFLLEFKYGEKEPAVEIQLMNTAGYQAMPFSVQKAFK